MGDGDIVPGSLYVYAPNKGAAIFFTIVYAASAVGHLWQCYCYKSWRMIGLHPLCAVLLTLGYAMRVYLAYDHYLYDKQILMIFILSQVFIFICPPLLELANYHILGRIFYYVPNLAPIPANKVMSIFGGLMALVELLNALGVALSTNPTGSNQGLGKILVLVALGLQLFVIIVFVAIAGTFHRRCAKAKIRRRGVPTLLITLNISMALILVRCIYRLVEHTGNTVVRVKDPKSLQSLSPLLRYEWFFYIFEATLMFFNSVLWNVWNPSYYLPRYHNVYLALDGTTEVEEEGVPDNRPFGIKAGYIALQVLSFGVYRPNK
ncbi:hypothetical protein BBP40_010508 [Aspergillus hancockii]|nr:hypothetical protein BBP40_010508 [Aspergillus hancockii]